MKEALSPTLSKCFLLFTFLFSLVGCNDSSTIGSDIFNDSILTVETTRMGVTIRAKPVLKDSIIVSPKNVCSSRYLDFIGQNEDDFYGDLKTEMYLGFVITETTLLPEFLLNAFVDSVVLQLNYGPFFSGDTSQAVDIEIRQIDEVLDPTSTYYSNQVLQTTFLNNHSFTPFPSDSVLRIPLDRSYGEFIIGLGVDILNNDSTFIDSKTALAVTASQNLASILSFNALSPLTKVEIYFTRPDTNEVLTLDISPINGSVNFTSYQHDYSAGGASQVLGSEVFGDSLIVADVLYGLETEITLSNIQLDTNNIINVAFIDVYSTQTEADLLLGPPNGLILFTIDDNGTRTRVNSAQTSTCPIDSRFNRNRMVEDIEGRNQYLYRLNITKEMQDLVVDPNVTELVFRLTSTLNILETNQFIGFGSGHSNLPLEVAISFTEF